MTNRIDFRPESMDHILFERELIERGIKYAKTNGFVFRFNSSVSFLFEDADYDAALKVAEKFQSSVYSGYPGQYLFNMNSSFSPVAFWIAIAVVLITVLMIELCK